jgi:hypothetical protein
MTTTTEQAPTTNKKPVYKNGILTGTICYGPMCEHCNDTGLEPMRYRESINQTCTMCHGEIGGTDANGYIDS